MCPVCLTDRWPSTYKSMHASPRQRCAHKAARACLHTHVCRLWTEAHSVSHHMRLMGKVMHLVSYMQTSDTLMHVFMVTHAVHRVVPLHAHLKSALYFVSLLTHTHTLKLACQSCNLCTFDPETFYCVFPYRHVQQLAGITTCHAHVIKLI